MLTAETKRKIDSLHDTLVGKMPVPSQRVELITLGLIYKFMSDIDEQNLELGAKKSFFNGKFKQYAWKNIIDRSLSGQERVNNFSEGLEKMSTNPNIPQLFRDIFKGAYLPFKDPIVLDHFLKGMDELEYSHSEELGNAFEYLLSVMGAQGDAGQFRTPRHIIDFIVEAVGPRKEDTILDPACGTAGFLISAYKQILKDNTKKDGAPGSALSTTDRKKLTKNFQGYDISHDMVRLSLANLYLHHFPEPKIYEYDTLSSEDRWDDRFDCILANPPFMTPKGGIRPHNRFTVQAKKSEVLFVDYIMEHLTTKGKAGVIVPEGIIFQSGNAYKALRKMLVDDGYLYAVISLPQGVFNPYSGVKTSILLLDKTLAKQSDSVLFVNVQNDGFDLGAQRRPIDKDDLPQTLKVVKKFKKSLQDGKDLNLGTNESTYSLLVPKKEIIQGGDYTLTSERLKTPPPTVGGLYSMVKLEDLVQITTGKLNANKAKENGKYPFYTCGKKILKIDDTAFDGESILLAGNGDFGLKYHPSGKFNAYQRTYVIKSKDGEKLLNRYLFAVLEQAVGSLLSQGGIIQYLRLPQIKGLEIPLPPLEIQEQIVAELNGYQKVIDGAKQVVDNYKPMILADSEWPLVELGTVCNFEGGTQPPKSTFVKEPKKDYIRLLQIRDYKNDKDAAYIPKSARHKECSEDDIMIGRYGPPVFQILRGKKGAYNVALMKCVPNEEKLTPDWLYYFLSSPPVQERIIGLSMRGRQAGVRPDDLNELKIPLPSLVIQRQFSSKIVEDEQNAVDANRKLIVAFEDKVKSRISDIWSKK